MNHHPENCLNELLTDAADDGGRPLPFSTADLARRGRRARRRRTATVAVGALVTLVAVAGGAVALAGGEHEGPGQAADPAPTAASSATSPGAPAQGPPPVTYADAAHVTQECDAVADRTSPHLADDGWRLDAEATDARGTTATFVSPDATQWATCALDDGAGGSLTPAAPLPTTAVPSSWRGDPTARDGSVAFGPGCADAKDQRCPTRDYTVVAPLRPGVAAVRLTSPYGGVPVVVGSHTYVARFVEPAPADGSSTPPMLITLVAPDGSTLVRYDLNEAMR